MKLWCSGKGRKVSSLFVAALALACGVSMQAQAATIFSDNFDAATLDPGWTTTTNFNEAGGFTGAIQVFGILGGSPPNSLEVFLNKVNTLTTLSNLFVDANHNFTTNNGTYTFTLQDRAFQCEGCTIEARVLVDGVLRSTNTTLSFSAINFSLALGAGTHTLSLEMFTNVANNGIFISAFDDVLITGPAPAPVPLPAALPLFATGLGTLGLLGWRRKRKAQAAA
jgi:hypothetical protein